MLLLTALFAPLAASAAEVTEMPPGLRADLGIGYGGTFGFGGLEEADVIYAKTSLQRHDLGVRGEFAPVTGLALGFQVAMTPSYKLEFSEATTMTFDPVAGGTYVGGEPIEDPVLVEAGGMEGIWLHAAFAPFSEAYTKLDQIVTWRLEVGFRPPSNQNFWVADDDGKRGIAPGGAGWRLSAAFSTDRGVASPYLRASSTLESRVTVDIPTLGEAEVDPASSLDLLGGVELVSSENDEKGTRFSFDLHAGFGYRSWADVPSGIFLPSVLDSSKTILVTQSEYLTGRAGLGAIVEMNQYVGFELGVEGQYQTPHRLEHPYAVRTSADTFAVAIMVGVDARIR